MDSKLLLTPNEAFARIGVGRSFGYTLIASGEIPSIKIGRLRRIPVEALERWVRSKSDGSAQDR